MPGAFCLGLPQFAHDGHGRQRQTGDTQQVRTAPARRTAGGSEMREEEHEPMLGHAPLPREGPLGPSPASRLFQDSASTAGRPAMADGGRTSDLRGITKDPVGSGPG